MNGTLPRALQRTPDAGIDEGLRVSIKLVLRERAVLDGHDEGEVVHGVGTMAQGHRLVETKLIVR